MIFQAGESPRRSPLQAIIRGRVAPEAVIHSDGWRGDDGLVDVGSAKHFRVHRGSNEFVRGNSHVNSIEGFWSFAKRRLQQLNGVSSQTFYLPLKECEYRFNNRNENLYRELLKVAEKEPALDLFCYFRAIFFRRHSNGAKKRRALEVSGGIVRYVLPPAAPAPLLTPEGGAPTRRAAY